jgi:hypothetical protein
MHHLRHRDRSAHDQKARPIFSLGLIIVMVILLWGVIIAVAVTIYETLL